MPFKNLPIFIQLIMMLLVIMVIPMTITVYYGTVSLTNYSEAEIADSVLKQLKSNSTLNERELFNIVQDVLSIAENSNLRNMKGITSYEVLNSNYNNIGKALKILSNIQNLQYNNEMIESVVFIPEDWNYVVCSKKSIMRKETYGNLDWFEKASNEMKGVSGYWYPRMEGNTPIITYLYRINRLTTSVKGVIVVNIYEDKLSQLLNDGNYKTDSSAFMIMEDSTILSHKDKSLLFENDRVPSYITEILLAEHSDGTLYREEEGKRSICAYYKPGNRNWIYGVIYPMKDLLVEVETIRNKQITLMIFIMGIGVIITLIYATRFSRPMRQLADELKKKNGKFTSHTNNNEITFLTQAFETLEKEEERLYLTLKEKEEDTKNIILQKLLTGEINEEIDTVKIKEIFPYKLFMLGMIEVDNRKAYLEKLDSRSRSYQRYLLFERIQKAFNSHYIVQAIRYEGGNIAVIINMEIYDQVQSPKEITAIFKTIQQSAQAIFKYTVSVGISGVHSSYKTIQECVDESLEASSKKIFRGSNSIVLWQPTEIGKQQDYYYPYESAEKMINYLSICDLEGISQELEFIESEISNRSRYLGYENVMMIFNQLIGVAIKFMMQHQINVAKVFGGKEGIYSTIASAETVSELKEILYTCYEKIIRHMLEKKEDQINDIGHSKRILDYLNKHYTEDLLYEEVAQQIGISYSYLRRIVKEETGKSVNDYINKIRIETMKTLLLTTDESISEIAGKVGYHNMQSVTRYFRKFEGITPKEFKTLNEL